MHHEVSFKGSGGGTADTRDPWKILERLRLTFVACTPMNVDYDGNFESRGTPGVPGGLVKADFGTQIRYPTILSAGYQYFQTPVPDRTYSPTIPDANQNVFTVGLGWRSGHHRIEGSYGYVLYDDRHISGNQNPAYNGNYEIRAHLISLAYGYSFF